MDLRCTRAEYTFVRSALVRGRARHLVQVRASIPSRIYAIPSRNAATFRGSRPVTSLVLWSLYTWYSTPYRTWSQLSHLTY